MNATERQQLRCDLDQMVDLAQRMLDELAYMAAAIEEGGEDQ